MLHAQILQINRGSFERCNKEHSCTNARLPCVKGAGAEGKTEGLSVRKTNFQPQRAQPFELCKKESSCTEVSLHLLEGEGDRAAVEGVNHGAKLTFVIREEFMATKQETVGAQEESTLPPSAFLWFFRFTRKERTEILIPVRRRGRIFCSRRRHGRAGIRGAGRGRRNRRGCAPARRRRYSRE